MTLLYFDESRKPSSHLQSKVSIQVRLSRFSSFLEMGKRGVPLFSLNESTHTHVILRAQEGDNAAKKLIRAMDVCADGARLPTLYGIFYGLFMSFVPVLLLETAAEKTNDFQIAVAQAVCLFGIPVVGATINLLRFMRARNIFLDELTVLAPELEKEL